MLTVDKAIMVGKWIAGATILGLIGWLAVWAQGIHRDAILYRQSRGQCDLLVEAAEEAVNVARAEVRNCLDKTQRAKEIAEDVSREYQQNLRAIDARLASLRKEPARCVPIVRTEYIATDRCDGGNLPTGDVSRRDGVSDQWLFEYAARADRVGTQLLACQSWLRNIN